jgi:hypothetical protein
LGRARIRADFIYQIVDQENTEVGLSMRESIADSTLKIGKAGFT